MTHNTISTLFALALLGCTSPPRPPDPQLLAAAQRTVQPNTSTFVTDGVLVSGMYFVVDSGYGYPRRGSNYAYSHYPFMPGISDVLYVDPSPIVTVGNFSEIRIDKGLDDKPEVRIDMDEIGAVRWQVATARSIDKQIAIVVGDSGVSAPTVLSEIPGGRASINVGGDATSQEALRLARMLKEEKERAAPVR